MEVKTMKRKIALLMAMVFALMCCFSSFTFAEEETAIEEVVVENKSKLYPYIYLFKQWKFDLWIVIIAC